MENSSPEVETSNHGNDLKLCSLIKNNNCTEYRVYTEASQLNNHIAKVCRYAFNDMKIVTFSDFATHWKSCQNLVQDKDVHRPTAKKQEVEIISTAGPMHNICNTLEKNYRYRFENCLGLFIKFSSILK